MGCLGAIASLLGAIAAGHAAEQRVGVITAVNPETLGRTATRVLRSVALGSEVIFDERLTTGEEGQAQILFLDQSSLTIAPKSELAIDRFVYDPGRDSGQIAATMTEGLLRYVGGRISKHTDVTIATPAAVVGIRGGIVLVEVSAGGATQATFLYGEHMTVTAGGRTEAVMRPGYTVIVQRAGEAPTAPVPVEQQALRNTLRALSGENGRHAGAVEVPTDARIAMTKLSQTVLTESQAKINQEQEKLRHLLVQDERHRKLFEFKLEELEHRIDKARISQIAARRHL